MELVLSLFPGIDLLGRAFSQAGFCVVNGPDLILDQRIEDFRPPPGHFNGVIGGPPCQNYSDANRRRDTHEGDRLLIEFARCVYEAQPEWFLMENVRNVPTLQIEGYRTQRLDAYAPDFGSKQTRLRHIQFGSKIGDIIRPRRTKTPRPVTLIPTLTTAKTNAADRPGRRLAKQGFPTLPLRAPTPAARRKAIGNGVPLQIGLELARAVTRRSSHERRRLHLRMRPRRWLARVTSNAGMPETHGTKTQRLAADGHISAIAP